MTKILAVPIEKSERKGKGKIRKSFPPTNHVVAAPQKGVMFTVLSQEEFRTAERTGAIPHKQHFFSPYPHMIADDAKLGLFGKRDAPTSNKPVFLVGVKMNSSMGLKPVPHGVPMYEKNIRIPISDVTEVHEVRPQTDSGFYQFRRMGGMKKAGTGNPIGTRTFSGYMAPVPAHSMTPGQLEQTGKLTYNTGVSNAPNSERVMSLHTPTQESATAHQNNAAWSQTYTNPKSLEYNQPIIRKFLEAGTHHLYQNTNYGTEQGTHYPTPDTKTITTPEEFDNHFPMMQDDLDRTAKNREIVASLGKKGAKKLTWNEIMDLSSQPRLSWTLQHKDIHQPPQQNYVYGPHLRLHDPQVWKDEILPYLQDNSQTEWDNAFLDHAQNAVANQTTYGRTNPEYMGNTGTDELRADHSMWHFADRSQALKNYLQERGYSGAIIPNYFHMVEHPLHSANELYLQANPHAVSEPINEENQDDFGVHQRAHQNIVDNADEWDKPPPPPQKPWEDPYLKEQPPIEQVTQPKAAVFSAVNQRLQKYGIQSQLTKNGEFLHLPDNAWKEQGGRWAEPHVATDIAKSAVATAFGVDPRIFNRITTKLSPEEGMGVRNNAAAHFGQENLSIRRKYLEGARGTPERKAYLYHTLIHEFIHGLQNEAEGATPWEKDKRFRNFNFGRKVRTNERIRQLEGYTDLAANVVTASLLGKDTDHRANLAYPKEVINLANSLHSEYGDNPHAALQALMERAKNPDAQEDYPMDIEGHHKTKQMLVEHFIDKMIDTARGDEPRANIPMLEQQRSRVPVIVRREQQQREKEIR